MAAKRVSYVGKEELCSPGFRQQRGEEKGESYRSNDKTCLWSQMKWETL